MTSPFGPILYYDYILILTVNLHNLINYAEVNVLCLQFKVVALRLLRIYTYYIYI